MLCWEESEFLTVIAAQQTKMGMLEEWTLLVQVCNFFKEIKVLPNKAHGNHKAGGTIVISQKVKKPLAAATTEGCRASSRATQQP